MNMKQWTIQCVIPPTELIKPTAFAMLAIWRGVDAMQVNAIQTSLRIAGHMSDRVPGIGASYISNVQTYFVVFTVRADVDHTQFVWVP